MALRQLVARPMYYVSQHLAPPPSPARAAAMRERFDLVAAAPSHAMSHSERTLRLLRRRAARGVPASSFMYVVQVGLFASHLRFGFWQGSPAELAKLFEGHYPRTYVLWYIPSQRSVFNAFFAHIAVHRHLAGPWFSFYEGSRPVLETLCLLHRDILYRVPMLPRRDGLPNVVVGPPSDGNDPLLVCGDCFLVLLSVVAFEGHVGLVAYKGAVRHMEDELAKIYPAPLEPLFFVARDLMRAYVRFTTRFADQHVDSGWFRDEHEQAFIDYLSKID